MSNFYEIPTRVNGQTIEADWYNSLKTKLEQSFGDNTMDAEVLWQAVATTQGTLPFPVMTTAQRTALSDIEGLCVFDSDLGAPYINDGVGWNDMGGGSGLTTHEADTSTHGVTEILGKDEAAVMTNKSTSDDFTVGGNLTVSGTTTSVGTVFDAEDPNLTVNKDGNDASAEGGGLTVERTGTDGSIQYEDALASKWKLNGLEAVTVSSTQTLTNKTLTSPTVNSPSVTTPSRLDVKQDTEANLITYAGTASSGQLCFATDTKKMYQVIDSALAVVGGGGVGSASIYALLDDSGDVTDWTTDGTATVTENSTGPIAGDWDYLVTVTAASQWVRTGTVALEPRSQYGNTTHSVTAAYTVATAIGGQWTVRVLDGSNVQISSDLVLDYSGGNPESFELLFNVPAGTSYVKLEIECNYFTASDKFKITDIEWNDQPFRSAVTTFRESIHMDSSAAMGSTWTYAPVFTTSVQDNTGDLLEITNTSADGFTATVRKDETYVTGTAMVRGVNTQFGFALNPTNSFLTNQTVTDILCTDTRNATNGIDSANASFSKMFNAGDVIKVLANATSAFTNSNVMLTASSDSDQIVREGEDRLSEWEDYTPTATGFGTISAAEGRWRRVGDTMEYRGSFAAGSSASVTASIDVPTGYQLDLTKMDSGSRDVLGLAHRLNGSNAVFSTADYTFSMFSDGSDNSALYFGARSLTDTSMTKALTPTAAGDSIIFEMTFPIDGWSAGMPELFALPAGDTNNFSARIANPSGTASIDDKNADFIQSVSRTSAGVVVVTWKSGFFTQPAAITAIPAGGNSQSSIVCDGATTTSCTFRTRQLVSDTMTDMDFDFTATRQGSDVRGESVFLGNVSPSRVMYIDTHATTYKNGVLATTSYKTRNLESLSGDIFGTISSDQLTLPIGRYAFSVPLGAYNGPQSLHFLLYDATNTTNIEEFLEVTYSNNTVEGHTIVHTTVELTASIAIEFQTKSASAGGSEYISRIKCEKLT